MNITQLKNKNILLLGYGIEGQATMRFLKHVLPGQCTIDIADQKNGPDYLEKQARYDLVIRSPGIPQHLLTRPHTTATNIFFGNVKGTTIGVTGSKGKSTTASLIYSFLKEAGRPAHLVGNIGNPMLATLLEQNSEHDIFVCELSSFQLDDIEYSPHVSLILNLFPEHMNYHGGTRNYFDAKKRMVKAAGVGDYFIYNPDYEELARLAKRTHARALPFISEVPFAREHIPLVGAHNRDNIRAAATAALLFDVDYETMDSALQKFKTLPHRLEHIGTFGGIIFYDDAISTAPESTIAAIYALPSIGTLLLGGQNRGYDFRALASLILEKKIPNVVLFPDSGGEIGSLLQKAGKPPPRILETRDMKEAVAFAYAHTQKNSICLLSSASPSYSLWKNFEEKGNYFQECVREAGYKKRE